MADFKEVSSEDFKHFIEQYEEEHSVELDVDSCGIFDPPKLLFHDFTNYTGWGAVIAYVTKYSAHPLPPDLVNDKYFVKTDTNG